MARKNKFIARKEREEKQAKLVRNIAIVIVVAVVLLIGYGVIDQNILQKNKAVATVNDEKITISQFQARVRLDRRGLINQYIQYAQMGQQFGMDVAAQLQPMELRLSQPLEIGQDVLDTMINEIIYKREAQKMDITFSEENVEAEVRNMMGYYPDGTPTSAPTDEPFVPQEHSTLSPEQLEIVTVTPLPTEAATSTPLPTEVPTEEVEDASTAIPTVQPVEMTATPYTLEGYESAYKDMLTLYTDLGLTEKDYRSLFESQLYFHALYEKITADVPTIGEEIWARHILVDSEELANEVLQRLEDGEDFAELAAELSSDSPTGDLGWFGRGRMVPEFEEAAFALKEIGEISEPVQSQFGFHIIQLLGREERPLDEQALSRAKDEVFQAWLAETRENYEIVTYDDFWKASVPSDPDLQETLTELFGAPPPAQ